MSLWCFKKKNTLRLSSFNCTLFFRELFYFLGWKQFMLVHDNWSASLPTFLVAIVGYLGFIFCIGICLFIMSMVGVCVRYAHKWRINFISALSYFDTKDKISSIQIFSKWIIWIVLSAVFSWILFADIVLRDLHR